MKEYARLLRMARSHVGKFLLALLCMAGLSVATAGMAYLVKPVIDDIFVNKDASMLAVIALAILLVAFIKGACSYGQIVLMSFIGQRVVTDLRNDLYNHIQRQSLSFFYRNPTGTLMSRITNDVTFIQMAVSEAVTSLLKDSLMLIALTFVIFYMNWKLALIALFVFPLAVYPIAKFGEKMRLVATDRQVTMGVLSSLLRET
ncbi:MAG: ABC transporter transmembrane domain-containing protein, partial [Syntrophales bacterium]|nr:ABC transporter transmembrane domain-containing protein [Syntrophales bacterium]